MKRCSTCHEWLDASEFNKQAAAWDGLQSRCRACSRQWYEANKVQHKAKARPRNQRVKLENRELMRQYLLQNPCVDCGTVDLRVLDFDHRDGAEKLANVGQLLCGGLAWSTILGEIAKCDVRCSNCHRIITSERADNWRQKAMASLDENVGKRFPESGPCETRTHNHNSLKGWCSAD